jgi:hypothetical protein
MSNFWRYDYLAETELTVRKKYAVHQRCMENPITKAIKYAVPPITNGSFHINLPPDSD